MATDQTYFLAVDLGTSGAKIVLSSAHGDILDCEFEGTPLLLLPDGGAEQRPDDWWNALKRAAKRVLAKQLVPAEQIAAICCTAQWSGTVAVGRDGEPLMNAVTWMDLRGAPYIKQITGGAIKLAGYRVDRLATWLRLTGGIPTHSGKDPIAHILYIKHEKPDIYQRTYKFLEPKDYLNLRLTGRCAASYESITLHWVTDNRNINSVCYHDGLLALVGVEREKLPELKHAIDILGPLRPDVAAELGLSERTQVVMGTPDVHSAAIGSGAVRDYEAHLYVGTSSWLVCHVPFKKTDVIHNMASLPSAIPGRYLLSNEQETAGACLSFLRDNLLYPDDMLQSGPPPADVYRRFDQLAAQAPAGSDGLLFAPWLYGERTPIEDSTVRGAFVNMSLRTTRAQLIRAVFEGVAFNSRWLMGYVEQFIKRPLGPINMIGGGASSPIWCQIFADILGRPIRQVADPIQANARGAAFLAMVALGHGRFEDIPNRIQISRTYQPNPDTQALYSQLFKEFVAVYSRNQSIFARLNRAH